MGENIVREIGLDAGRAVVVRDGGVVFDVGRQALTLRPLYHVTDFINFKVVRLRYED